jgi:flagellar hook-basal body complex protein FliE
MNTIGPLQATKGLIEGLSKTKTLESSEIGFKDRLAKVLGDVNQLQLDSGEAAQKFVSGEIDDVHDVMIAAEKASVSLELTLEVRNKLLEAYREIMRIQM